MTSLLRRRAPGVVGVLIELAVVGVALLVNLLVRRLTLDDVEVALAHARSLLALQERLHLDWEHAAQSRVEDVPWLGSIAAWFYVWGYLPVVVLALVVLFVRAPHDYARLRNALLAAGIVGLPVYVLYPLAPPRLTGLGYTDTVAGSLVEGAARPVGIANEI
ncbi:MAG TPA: phosphatase PAP2 family protein, partial [Nocardioides sp.]